MKKIPGFPMFPFIPIVIIGIIASVVSGLLPRHIAMPCGIILIIAIARFGTKYRIKNNLKLPKPAFFVMRQVLKIRKNPDHINDILKRAGIENGMKILDYGTGIGSYAVEAAKIVGNKGKIVAADIDQGMINALNKTIRANGIPKVIQTQLIDTMEDIKDTNYDFVLLMDVLHLINNKKETLQYMKDKLHEKGKMLLRLQHFKRKSINALFENFNYTDKIEIAPKHYLISI